MPSGFVDLSASPLVSDQAVRLHVRERGHGVPLLFLHGGWGYGVYAYDAQMAELAHDFRCVAPDRTGYGASTPLTHLPLDFHARAAEESRHLLDALGIDRARLWGHSDGAVIAALLAMEDPARFPAVVLEALHLWKRKPGSRAFFETAAHAPEAFGRGVATALAADHGDRWRDVVRMNGRAWLRLADEAKSPTETLYGGTLPRLDRTRVLLLHGGRDPRTEPGELEAVRTAVPSAEAVVLPDAGHSPHSEATSAKEATRRVAAFLRAR